MTHTAIITIKNATIKPGEYMAAYGHGESHMQIFNQYVKLPKSAIVNNVYTEGNIEINIETPRALSKTVMSEINRFIEYGFILECNIDGVELIEKPAQAPAAQPESAEPTWTVTLDEAAEQAEEVQAYNEQHRRCACVAVLPLDCTALRYSVDREHAIAYYGPCVCACHYEREDEDLDDVLAIADVTPLVEVINEASDPQYPSDKVEVHVLGIGHTSTKLIGIVPDDDAAINALIAEHCIGARVVPSWMISEVVERRRSALPLQEQEELQHAEQGEVKRYMLGSGYLSWHRCERITDRYGSVGLWQNWSTLTDDDELPMQLEVEHLVGKHGTMSVYLDDGVEYVLGSGTLFTTDHQIQGACYVGVEPDDKRETIWLDASKLHRVDAFMIDKPVELYFTEQ